MRPCYPTHTPLVHAGMEQRKSRRQAQKSLPSHAMTPHPVLHLRRTVSPILASPPVRATEVHNYSASFPWNLNQARDPWAMRYYYLLLNYMKMKSCKKKQTPQIHESHLLLVNSSGSQLLGFTTFSGIREPRQGFGVLGIRKIVLITLASSHRSFLTFP